MLVDPLVVDLKLHSVVGENSKKVIKGSKLLAKVKKIEVSFISIVTHPLNVLLYSTSPIKHLRKRFRIPDAILQALFDNNVIHLIVALAFGVVLRALKAEQVAHNKIDYVALEQVIGTLCEAVIRILSWVIALVPLAVFSIVAKTVALQGFAPFKALECIYLSCACGSIFTNLLLPESGKIRLLGESATLFSWRL